MARVFLYPAYPDITPYKAIGDLRDITHAQ
jgi:hypothetical protein